MALPRLLRIGKRWRMLKGIGRRGRLLRLLLHESWGRRRGKRGWARDRRSGGSTRQVRPILDGLEEVVGEGSRVLSQKIGHLRLEGAADRFDGALVAQQRQNVVGQHIGIGIGSGPGAGR